MRLISSALLAIAAVSVAALPLSAEMIHLMARKGDLDKVLALIDQGVPVDLPSTRNTSEENVTPLYVAAKFGRAEVVAALLNAGADQAITTRWGEGVYSSGTPMHVAARWGHVDVVRLLLTVGGDPAQPDPFAGTPLHLALRHGHNEIAEMLVAAGAPERFTEPSVAGMLASADVQNGQTIAAGCAYCHVLVDDDGAPSDTGPGLWNVVGRPLASAADYPSSSAMAAKGGVWDYDRLSSYLASPYEYLPGTSKRMIGFADKKARADLIAFLRTLSNSPAPLP